MAYEEYDAKQIIPYTLGNVESMRKALTEYGELIESGRGFEDRYCVVQFKPDVEEIKLSNFEDNQAIVNFATNNIIESSDDRSSVNLIDSCLTETLFFMCAMMHEELRPNVKSACESIVSYARKINDSSEMWITCEQPFGEEPLLLCATVCPEYGYLLAGFFVAYWDDEHMPESLQTLSNWASGRGVNADTIKAFCYCDNSSARSYMLGYDQMNSDEVSIGSDFDLISHFRNKPDDYQLFKDIMLERFQQQSYLQEHDDDERYYNLNPIQSWVLDMMFVHHPYDIWDDGFDKDNYLTQTFVSTSAEQEIDAINLYISGRLGRPIVPSFIEWQKLKLESQQAAKSETVVLSSASLLNDWKELITLNITPRRVAANAWDYIETGEKSYILDKFTPVDELEEFESLHNSLADDIEKNVYSVEDFALGMHQPLQLLFQAVLNREELSEDDNKATLLRLMDVIHLLTLDTVRNSNVKNLLVEKFALCNEDEYNSRYRIDWYKTLEKHIKEFDDYSDYAERKDLDACYQIINENRGEALDTLNSKLFVVPDHNAGFNIESLKDYGTVQALVVAAMVISKDRERNVCDDITSAARHFIEQHATKTILDNMFQYTSLPDCGMETIIVENRSTHIQQAEIEEAKELLIFKNQIRSYFITGRINEETSEHLSTIETRKILERYLKYNYEDISIHQKSINWFSGSNDDFQKLMYVAYASCSTDDIDNIDALKRILRMAFTLAPIRTTHCLSKAFKLHAKRTDAYGQMEEVLNKFRSYGLCAAGYWGYIMGELSGRNRGEEEAYKAILAELTLNHRTNPPLFISGAYNRELSGLKDGIEMLRDRNQLTIVDDIAKYYPDNDVTKIYDSLLVRTIQKLLVYKDTLLDLPKYFANRLRNEGHYCELIDWTDWHNHEELLNTVMNEVSVSKPSELSQDEAYQTILDSDKCKYIVLQKQGDKLVLVYGDETLALIQKGLNADIIDVAKLRCILIDSSAPQANYDELIAWSNIDHRELWTDKIVQYISTQSSITEVENIIRGGIRPYIFENNSSLNDISLPSIIHKVSEPVRQFTLRLLGMISYEALGSAFNKIDGNTLDTLIKHRVDSRNVFNLLVKEKQHLLIPNLAIKVDITPFVNDARISTKIAVLPLLAHLAPYHPLIIRLEDDKSMKLKECVKNLITLHNIKSAQPSTFKVVDYGLYSMEGNTDPESGSSRKTAREPHCINQTNQFKGVVGSYFGLRFTTVDPQNAPQISQHTVTVKHPTRNGSGEIVQAQSQWDQNGYSRSNIFMGWYFDPAEELIPGKYHMAAHDTDGVMLAEMEFEVQ
ncbi:DUF3859 domain-containing protein [Saccharicrinis aurantiacus]|uniref:DUF3859 domain-containing protein n=1 Tax=Saccharicrinis aurantiacus TaxID=1849719 RepID=UPI00094FF55F|nr:DUF3859 domain-containing protein [Saccharicrinis aurantiacus]